MKRSSVYLHPHQKHTGLNELAWAGDIATVNVPSYRDRWELTEDQEPNVVACKDGQQAPGHLLQRTKGRPFLRTSHMPRLGLRAANCREEEEEEEEARFLKSGE
ncbi:hypothetical protein JRQ81_008553 [Phrynocephalus forsythii]|uniref:Uncharacterized protein n=1 Tax=Phrynocephalus forsythii TaxID=171643 RepID=A0A9Q0XAB5_9SAUR|nr:hypothetical protein JRQ81_008553 [Phrynocephalus forsythii]